MSKSAKYKYTWNEILVDPTLNRLAKRLNRQYAWLSEEAIESIINVCFDAKRMLDDKEGSHGTK